MTYCLESHNVAPFPDSFMISQSLPKTPIKILQTAWPSVVMCQAQTAIARLHITDDVELSDSGPTVASKKGALSRSWPVPWAQRVILYHLTLYYVM